MSPALKFFLAMCGVALAGGIAYAASGPALGRLVFLSTLAGLLVGMFVPGGAAHAGAPPPHTPFLPEYEFKPRGTITATHPRALLDATTNAMREGVIAVDGSLRVMSINRVAASVFGGVGVEVFGQPLSVVTRQPEINEAFRTAVEAGRRQAVKVEVRRGGARRRVLELRVAPLALHDDKEEGARGALGVFFDLTEVERLEQVRQEFLSNVSHELRTPLTSIMAFVETLEGGALEEPEDARRFVSVIRRNAERMRGLIEDIAELSAIESGAAPVEPRPVSLRPVAQEAANALALKAAARDITLNILVEPDAVVGADLRRLEQMLLNLIDNAIKFGRQGGTVTVTHERDAAHDLIRVTDDGEEGIPAEHLPRVFERFYRVERARTSSSAAPGGSGLGLAIVKHLARAHGGDVSVVSAPGAGTTFTIVLPHAPIIEAPHAKSEDAG